MQFSLADRSSRTVAAGYLTLIISLDGSRQVSQSATTFSK